MADQLLADLGGVDMLINNAGHSIRWSLTLSYDRIHGCQRTMQLELPEDGSNSSLGCGNLVFRQIVNVLSVVVCCAWVPASLATLCWAACAV
ncbi:hypothetical protein A8144_12550 [Mycobacterium leprae 3125609]|nr:hypothetical protein [Mycobacterium leprae]OAR20053.1 hypothetical protein A8144_12550 [Mycobacterium leprae 3125609]OAX70400.1 hypothetical protein A3216_12210 [Mycobacterium leprae 7935681]